MKMTNDLIHLGLLGTTGKELLPSDIPPFLHVTLEKIKASQNDTEDGFYKIAAALFTCCRSGAEPVSRPEAQALPEALPEEKAYLSVAKARLLSDLLQNNNISLLLYGYDCTIRQNQLLPPGCLPDMLSHAFEKGNPNAYEEKKRLSQLIGNRGNWYLQRQGLQCLEEEKELPWDTSTHAQRRALLRDIRLRDPQKALEMLCGEWKNESAQHRAELLECLEVRLSVADEVFITEAYKADRSETVRNTALSLLQRLPESQVVRFYWDTLKEHLRYRRFFGWSVTAIEYSEELKKYGIAEISRNKGESDSDYILRQLCESVPLAFWCELFDCDRAKAAERLRENPPFAKYFTVSRPVLRFNDREWAFILSQKTSQINYAYIPLLTPAQREQLNFNNTPVEGIHPDRSWFGGAGEPWGVNFSTHVLKMILGGRFFYQDKETSELLAFHIPPEMKRHLLALEQKYADDAHGRAEYCRRIRQYMEIKNELEK
ncbi:MAG: DUF5691 domain-containing protein [Tannerella sp.]|uniref:DUF5691 domain-containing protein n=1 Tax=Tannerella sp. TaxID=2382127 RepID=UPI003FA273A1